MTQTTNVSLTAELQEATQALAEHLLHSEKIIVFHQATDRLLADSQASQLLNRLSAAQAELRGRRARNQVSQADVENIRSLQRAVQANATIMSYAQAQKTAMDYLAEINQEIGQLLGVDFAALASPGCCG